MASLHALAVALAALAGACAFDEHGLPPGQAIRDDSAADFRASGATATGIDVSDDGRVSPTAYTTGALLAKGANSVLFTDGNTADWATIDATMPARVALSAPFGDFSDKAPVGVGIVNRDNYSLWVTGEIWLEAGDHGFHLAADDTGFLDLAPPGGTFTRVLATDWTKGDTAATFTATTTGWYGVRAAMAELVGAAGLRVGHQPPGGTLAPLDPDRLRAPVGALRGLVADAFDNFYLVKPVGRSLTASGMLAQDFGTSVPSDTGITAASTYSFHWSAQVRIDVAGDYAFQLDSDDGHRLRVDGVTIADHLVAAAQSTRTAPIHLDQGWHDIVIDYTQYAASAKVRLLVASGPDLAGSSFPLDRVRPVVPRADRVAGASDDNDLAIPIVGATAYTLTPAIPAGATVDGVDVVYTVDVPHGKDLQIAVIGPDGSSANLRALGDPDRTGRFAEVKSSHGLDGKAAAGSWKLEFRNATSQGGNAREVALTVHYVGGKPPFESIAAYESAPRDLGAPSQIDDVAFSAATPTGTAVAVKLRTGADLDELKARPWSDPVTSGEVPIVAPGQLVQYRVELSSDGDHAASLDWIELVYRAVR